MIAFVVTTVFSTVLVATVLSVGLRKEARDQLRVSQATFAAHLAAQITRELGNARQHLIQLAKHPAVRSLPDLTRVDPEINGIPEDADRAKRYVLTQFLETVPDFSILFLLQPSGDHYLSQPFSVQKAVTRFNLSERPYFKAAVLTREPVMSDGFVGADGVPAVVIDIPILNAEGEITAHLGGVFHLTDLSRFVDANHIGPNSAAFLIDGQGNLIAHTDTDRLATWGREAMAGHPLLVHDRLEPTPAGTSRPRFYADPVSGEEFLGAVVPLGNHWQLGVTRSMAMLHESISAKVYGLTALVTVLMIAVSAIGVLAAQSLSSRWHQAESALRRSRDEMEEQVMSRGGDLIATNEALAKEIRQRQQIEEELRGQQQKLEEMISRRTKALTESNMRLESEIDHRRKIEKELREREEYLRSVINNAPLVLFATDADGIVTVSEGRGLEGRGRKAGQVVGMSMFDIYLDRPDVVTRMRRALAGETVSYEVFLSGRWYRSVYTPRFGQDGSVEGFVGVSTDITDRVTAESALRANEISLQQAQRIARLGSWDWDLRENRMTWSAELRRMLDESGPTSYAAYLDRVHPEDRAKVREGIASALDDGGEVIVEHRVVTRGGKLIPVELRGEAISAKHGGTTRMLATVRNMEVQPLDSDVPLDPRQAPQTEFSTDAILHDLKEPLNSLVMHLEELGRGRSESGPAAGESGSLTKVRDLAHHVQSIVAGMSELTAAGRASESPVPVDLAKAAQAAMTDLSTEIEASGAEISLGSMPVILGNPTRLRQLLQNLIGNAVKYAKPGQAPQVWLRGTESGNRIRVTVEDAGLGIEDDDADELFCPFRRGAASGDTSGRGLGLAICRRIVELQGGEIRLVPRAGGGAAAIVEWPATLGFSAGASEPAGPPTTGDRPV